MKEVPKYGDTYWYREEGRWFEGVWSDTDFDRDRIKESGWVDGEQVKPFDVVIEKEVAPTLPNEVPLPLHNTKHKELYKAVNQMSRWCAYYEPELKKLNNMFKDLPERQTHSNEQAYKRGLCDGREEEAIKCDEHCKQAALAALEEAIAGVPEAETLEEGRDIRYVRKTVRAFGFNDCRDQILSTLSALKKKYE